MIKECDCLIYCGDDPWLNDGRVKPCKARLKALKQEAKVQKLREQIEPLYKFYAVKTLHELVLSQAQHIERLQGKLKS